MTRPNVNDVFTPRRHEVNSAMYISRPYHEKELARSVEGGRHTVLSGESGSGKSWLYWHVAAERKWCVFYANAANAARFGSVAQTISQAILDPEARELKDYTQSIEAKAEVFGTGGGSTTERRYEVRGAEALLRAFEEARKKSADRCAVVVIDNLEAIFGSDGLMAEVANIILLLDDPVYAKHHVKILIVGVPGEIIEYYQKIRNLESVANRLQEAPTVQSMNKNNLHEFVERGFCRQLQVYVSPTEVKDLVNHVERCTLGIAQRLHEYCEILGYRIQDNGWRYDTRLKDAADSRYLNDCLKKAYSVIEGCMNEKATKAGRRNQVLYSLGKISATSFDAKTVEAVLRTEFPKTTGGVSLAVSQTMGELCEGDPALLRAPTKGASFRFADPRYLICLRLMLDKDDATEKVNKKPLRR